MDRRKRFLFGFSSKRVFKLGFLVKDVGVAMPFYLEILKMGPFFCRHGVVPLEGVYRGSSENPSLTIAHGFGGNYFIELIQQDSDIPSVYKEFYDMHGYGLHHFGIAIAPDDYDETLANYYRNGFENVFEDRAPTGARISYIALKDRKAMENMYETIGVGYLECVEMIEEAENFFTGIYEAASAWDGKTVLIQ